MPSYKYDSDSGHNKTMILGFVFKIKRHYSAKAATITNGVSGQGTTVSDCGDNRMAKRQQRERQTETAGKKDDERRRLHARQTATAGTTDSDSVKGRRRLQTRQTALAGMADGDCGHDRRPRARQTATAGTADGGSGKDRRRQRARQTATAGTTDGDRW